MRLREKESPPVKKKTWFIGVLLATSFVSSSAFADETTDFITQNCPVMIEAIKPAYLLDVAERTMANNHIEQCIADGQGDIDSVVRRIEFFLFRGLTAEDRTCLDDNKCPRLSSLKVQIENNASALDRSLRLSGYFDQTSEVRYDGLDTTLAIIGINPWSMTTGPKAFRLKHDFDKSPVHSHLINNLYFSIDYSVDSTQKNPALVRLRTEMSERNKNLCGPLKILTLEAYLRFEGGVPQTCFNSAPAPAISPAALSDHQGPSVAHPASSISPSSSTNSSASSAQ
jgi:hypothetical protein